VGVVRGIPLVPTVVNLELGFSIQIKSSRDNPRFALYATLERPPATPSTALVEMPEPDGAGAAIKSMLATVGWSRLNPGSLLSVNA